MKKGIHPESYRLVVFKDMSNDYTFLTRSTAPTKETIVWEDGKEYPVIKVEISHKSHPFYTGKSVFVDTAGRIDKFKKALREEEIIFHSHYLHYASKIPTFVGIFQFLFHSIPHCGTTRSGKNMYELYIIR